MRYAAVALFGAAAFGLAGCSGGEPAEANAPAETGVPQVCLDALAAAEDGKELVATALEMNGDVLDALAKGDMGTADDLRGDQGELTVRMRENTDVYYEAADACRAQAGG